MPVKGFDRIEDHDIEKIVELYWDREYRGKKVVNKKAKIPYICDFSGVEYSVSWDSLKRSLFIKRKAGLEERVVPDVIRQALSDGVTLEEMEKMFDTTYWSLVRYFDKNDINASDRQIKKLSDSEIKSLIDKYKAPLCRRRDLIKEFGIGDNTIVRILKENGVKVRSREKVGLRKFNPKPDCFKQINSERSAYFFGLMLADGCVTEKSLLIGLQEADKHILEEFLDFLYHEDRRPSLKFRKMKSKKQQNQFRLACHCTPIINDLKSFGCYSKKSYTAKVEISKIDPIFYRHILRGIFDGDGTVGYYKIKSTGHFSSAFSIVSASPHLIDFISMVLSDAGIKCFERRATNKDGCEYQTVSTNSVGEIEKVFRLMYEDSCVFLDRKFKKFLKLFKNREKVILKLTSGQLNGKYIGVCQFNQGKFDACVNSKYIKRFKTAEEAAIAVNKRKLEIDPNTPPEKLNWLNREGLIEAIDFKPTFRDLNIKKDPIYIESCLEILR